MFVRVHIVCSKSEILQLCIMVFLQPYFSIKVLWAQDMGTWDFFGKLEIKITGVYT